MSVMSRPADRVLGQEKAGRAVPAFPGLKVRGSIIQQHHDLPIIRIDDGELVPDDRVPAGSHLRNLLEDLVRERVQLEPLGDALTHSNDDVTRITITFDRPQDQAALGLAELEPVAPAAPAATVIGGAPVASLVDDVDDLVGVRLDDDDVVLHHEVAIAAVLRHDVDDRGRDRVQLDAARHARADRDREVDVAQLPHALPAEGLADSRAPFLRQLHVAKAIAVASFTPAGLARTGTVARGSARGGAAIPLVALACFAPGAVLVPGLTRLAGVALRLLARFPGVAAALVARLLGIALALVPRLSGVATGLLPRLLCLALVALGLLARLSRAAIAVVTRGFLFAA